MVQADNHTEISRRELVEALQRGDHVLLDDGRIELVVRSVEGHQAECSVLRGGLLGERKGVSVPGRPLPLPALTEKDHEDLKLAVELQVDWIALSFVRQPEDVLLCQKHLGDLACKVPVIAKLEKLEAIRNLSKILEVADAVMVARGDLGVELKLGDLPAVQKDVIHPPTRAATAAGELGARVIIDFRESGTTALRCSQARPRVTVVAASPRPEVLRKTALYSGVIPLLVSPSKDTDQMVANATEAARESGLVRVGDTVVVVAGVPVGLAGQTNLLKVETV